MEDILQFESLCSKATYSVDRGFIAGKDGTERLFYLILRNGLPATDLNKCLILKQQKSAHPCSTGAYVIAKMLNDMLDRGFGINDISRGLIYDYLLDAYVEEGLAYKTILSYITIIGDLFDDLKVHNIPIHESLLILDDDVLTVVKNKKERRYITNIPLMRKELLPNKNAVISNSMLSYTKWYTKDQVDALAAELPLVYRCIFLDTVMTGHRVDSALSITLTTFNAREQYIMPTRTKTGRYHRSHLPDYLAELIYTYQSEERTAIVRKTQSASEYLFLGRNGDPVSYAAYRAALITAGKHVQEKHPELGLTTLHTHAGRSTFAAALRSFQKSQEAKGIHTFSDDDFCKQMDWASLQCLENYDILTRAQTVSPIIDQFQTDFFSFTSTHSIELLEEDNA